ncbi:MAG: protein kinase [Deltaproteobacteria bacterium]|nr:protein kinase [Deltaproteobacteria bacterium]
MSDGSSARGRPEAAPKDAEAELDATELGSGWASQVIRQMRAEPAPAPEDDPWNERTNADPPRETDDLFPADPPPEPTIAQVVLGEAPPRRTRGVASEDSEPTAAIEVSVPRPIFLPLSGSEAGREATSIDATRLDPDEPVDFGAPEVTAEEQDRPASEVPVEVVSIRSTPSTTGANKGRTPPSPDEQPRPRTPGSGGKDNSARPDFIAGYKIDKLIGQGGMGKVYLGVHSKLGRRAAIKVLAPNLAKDEAFVERFLREARIANDVRHEHIVDIHDFVDVTSESRRLVAYVMEYIEAPSLRKRLEKEPMTVVETLYVAAQVASALSAVHKVGVIHRDLKPDNVLVSAADPPKTKILDFGIAKIIDAAGPGLTTRGELLGTPAYMAPEQTFGGIVTAKADIYAFGELLFEMLAGRPLFRGDTVQLAQAKASGERSIILPPQLPRGQDFRVIIQKCTEVHPNDRPTIDDVWYALVNELATSISPELPGKLPKPPSSPGLLSRGSAPRGSSAARQSTVASGRSVEMVAPRLIAETSSRPSEVQREIPPSTSEAMTSLALGEVVASLEPAKPVTILEEPRRAIRIPTSALYSVVAGLLGVALAVAILRPRTAPSGPATYEAEPTAQLRRVSIDSRPSGARVLDPDTRRQLGVTPLTVDLISKSRFVLLELKSFRPANVELREGEGEVVVELQEVR